MSLGSPWTRALTPRSPGKLRDMDTQCILELSSLSPGRDIYTPLEDMPGIWGYMSLVESLPNNLKCH